MNSVATAASSTRLMRSDPRVLGDLLLWSERVDVGDLTGDVEKRFTRDPSLPGCVVCKGDTVIGVLSRKQLFAALSKPFSRDLFIRRPLESLVDIDVIDTRPLRLPVNTDISIAVDQALSRDTAMHFEPVLVEGGQGPQLIEVDVMLRTQSGILKQAIRTKDDLIDQVQRSAQELRTTLESLEKTRDRLLQSEERLEAEVERRTLELATTNAELIQKQNQIDEELTAARSLQQSILPDAFPDHEGYSGKAFMRAARMIGGDFYDVFPLEKDRVGVMVADVSGKGVPAALFMVLARTVLQDLALRGHSPGECVRRANEHLIARNPLWLFVTVIYGILDVRTGVFTFCNAGHIMPYVLRANGAVEVVSERASPLVGLIEQARFCDLRIVLEPGDGLMMVTDGVGECFNRDGEAFGETRLLDLIAAAGSRPLESLLDDLVTALDRFSDGIAASDDVTVLVLKHQGLADSVSRVNQGPRPGDGAVGSQLRRLR
jgi:serine phosphatase RsbU (regulator of sigma subunit)